MIAIFVDIDCLINLENKAWIVDKSKPNIPIMKIPKEDFNLYRSGIYKSQGNKIEFNGKTFWLPNDIFNRLKVKLKNNDSSLGNLAISMQEFMNTDLIDNLPFEFNSHIISMLKNQVNDIYIICSKQTKKNYENIIKKLEEEFLEKGIQVKKYYHISETFYNQTDDDILFKKSRLYLQHLIGYKTEGKKFVDSEIKRYDKIKVFDDNKITINMKDEVNIILKTLLSNTDPSLSSVLKEIIDEQRPSLEINITTDNQVNRLVTFKVVLDYSNLIRSFESFTYFSNKNRLSR